MSQSRMGAASSSHSRAVTSKYPTPAPSAPSSASAPIHSASTGHASDTREDARVVVLLNGERVKFNASLTSSGKLGGTLASLTLHDQILRFVSEKEGRASQGLVLLFGSEERLGYEMGEEKARLFVQSFNTTESFASAFIEVGTREGAATETICTHLPLHLSSSDHLVLGAFTAESSSSDSKLESALKNLAHSTMHHKIALLKLEDQAVALASEIGVGMVSFGDVLEPRRESDATPPAPSQITRAALEGAVCQVPSSADSVQSSEWTPPPSAQPPQAESSAGWGDPLAMLASLDVGQSSAPAPPKMKTHPTTFAKARPIAAPSPRPPPGLPPIQAPPPPPPSSTLSSGPSHPSKESPWIFFPLTKLLHEQQAQHPRPLRSHIGGLLSKTKKGRYALNKYGGFREYARAAERKGLVEMGAGETLGKDWIALTR